MQPNESTSQTSTTYDQAWVDGPGDSDEARIGHLLARAHPGGSWRVVAIANDLLLASGSDGGRDAALDAVHALRNVDLRGLSGWRASASGKASWRRLDGYSMLAGQSKDGSSWWVVKDARTDATLVSGQAVNELAARVAAAGAVRLRPALAEATAPVIKPAAGFQRRRVERAAAQKPSRIVPRKLPKRNALGHRA